MAHPTARKYNQLASIATAWGPAESDGRFLLHAYAATTAVVAAAGNGYNVGDVITLTGGTFTTATTLTVATLTGGAGTGVATVTITGAGRYSVVPSNPVAQGSASPATGTGATFTMTYADTYMNHATTPIGLSECFRMTWPGQRERYGIYLRNTFSKTAGAGTTWACSLASASILCAMPGVSADLLSWPQATNLGNNTGGPVFHMGHTSNPSSQVVTLNQATVGKATITIGDVWGGYIGFASDYIAPNFEPYGDVAYWIYLKPNAVPGSGNTFVVTTEVWEVYG